MDIMNYPFILFSFKSTYFRCRKVCNGNILNVRYWSRLTLFSLYFWPAKMMQLTKCTVQKNTMGWNGNGKGVAMGKRNAVKIRRG